MPLNVFLFYTIAGLTGLSAIAMVVTQNIVRAAAWLLFTLAGVSGIYFLLGAHFLGATQLLIYVGGTLVLVIFGVMLTAQGPFINIRPRSAEWVISTFVGLALFGTLTVSFLTTPKPPQQDFAKRSKEQQKKKEEQGEGITPVSRLGMGFLGVKEASGKPKVRVRGADISKPSPPFSPTSEIERNVNHKYRKRIGYLLPFEIISVHLLVVLVGAAYLARTKRRAKANAPAESST